MQGDQQLPHLVGDAGAVGFEESVQPVGQDSGEGGGDGGGDQGGVGRTREFALAQTVGPQIPVQDTPAWRRA